MDGSETRSSETQNKHRTCQQILSNVQRESCDVHSPVQMIEPLLLGQHDQSEVDLHEGEGPEDEQH